MNLPWIDIETTGLREREDAILEIGVVITDENLKTIDMESWVCKPSRNTPISEIDPYVQEMHQKSGLWVESLSCGLTLDAIAEYARIFILKHCDEGAQPACGSSVHFDRRFIKAQAPQLDKVFHYRNIDVSSLTNLVRMYQPQVYESAPEGEKKHRAVDDCLDSIALLKHYMQWIEWLPR